MARSFYPIKTEIISLELRLQCFLLQKPQITFNATLFFLGSAENPLLCLFFKHFRYSKRPELLLFFKQGIESIYVQIAMYCRWYGATGSFGAICLIGILTESSLRAMQQTGNVVRRSSSIAWMTHNLVKSEQTLKVTPINWSSIMVGRSISIHFLLDFADLLLLSTACKMFFSDWFYRIIATGNRILTKKTFHLSFSPFNVSMHFASFLVIKFYSNKWLWSPQAKMNQKVHRPAPIRSYHERNVLSKRAQFEQLDSSREELQ